MSFLTYFFLNAKSCVPSNTLFVFSASKVTKQLTSLTRQVGPGDVMSVEGLHQVLGISVHPGNTHITAAPSQAATQLSPSLPDDNAMETASNVSSAFIGAESVDSPMTDMIGLD